MKLLKSNNSQKQSAFYDSLAPAGTSMNACPYSRTWQDSGQEIGMTQLLRILFLCFNIEAFQLKSTCCDYDDRRSDRAGGKSNSVLTQFIKHMNKATLSTVISYNY